MGAVAILDSSSNLWAPLGLNHYLELTDNLRRIESVWLKVPILVNGRKEPPAMILPDGSLIKSSSANKRSDFAIFPVELKFK